MRHIDLFSGIGGFALAAREVWGDDHEVVTFCEINKYAQQVLKKHWPYAPICEDIRKLNKEWLCEKYAQNAKNQKEQKVVHIVNHVTQNEQCYGEKKIGHLIEKVSVDGAEKQKKDLSSTTAVNVRVAGNQDTSSLHSITRITTEMKKEKYSKDKHGKQLSKEDCPTTIRSFATTVTTPKHTLGHVHTNKELKIDLLTGGFPCQPFSNAGKKRGKDDDRYLWDEMLRVIKEFKPRWIVGENVAGLIGMAQQQGDAEVGGETDTESGDYDQSEAGGLLFGIIDDIEQAGYTVQAFVIPACAVNAPHRRDRIWIVAHSTSDRCELRKRDREERHIQDPSKREVEENKSERSGRFNRSCEANNVASDSGCELREQRNGKGMEICSSERPTGTVHAERCGENAPNGISERLEGRSNERSGLSGQLYRDGCHQRRSWDQNWIEVATEFCGVDDGVSVELDGLKLSKSQHRVERLKALGNAIVPSVVMEIFKAIKEVDNEARQRGEV